MLLALVSGDDRAGEPHKRGQRGRFARTAGIPVEKAMPPGAVRAAHRGFWVVESGPIDFGELTPEIGTVVPDAIRVRVFAAGSWKLKLVPRSPFTNLEAGRITPATRLEWRDADAGGYRPFPDKGFVVASGPATTESGELVRIDLRLTLGSEDDLGHYGLNLGIELDVM